MSDDLNFQLALLDNMSGPTNKATGALYQLNQQLNILNQTNNTFNTSVTGSAKSTESWMTSLSSAMNVATKFKDTLVGVISTVTELTASFSGAVLEQASFHQRAMTTLDALLQDEPGGARREFSGSIRMAMGLPGGARDVAEARVGLAATYQDRDERDRMFALQQDLAALSFHQDAGTSLRSLAAITDVTNAGVLRSEELRQLVNLKAGIGKGDVFRQIAQARGLQGDSASIFRQVQALVSDNQISAQEGLRAYQNAVVAKTHMDLGGLAHHQGAGLLGQISNAKELGTNTLLTLFSRQESTTSSPGMSAFLEFLTNTNKFFEQGTETGERFLKVVDDLVNSVFGQLFSNNPTPILNTMLTMFESLVPVVTSVLAATKAFGAGIADTLLPMVQPLMDMLGGLQDTNLMDSFRTTGQLIGAVLGLLAWLVAAIIVVVPTMIDLGIRLVQGLAEGLVSGAHWLWDGIKNLAEGAVKLFKEIWGIHSPSVVMFGMGHHLSEGLALGIESGEGRVGDALAGSFQAAGDLGDFGVSGPSLGGMGRGPVELNITFNVPNSAATAQEIADATKPMFETALAELVERMAISAGVG